MSETGKTTIIVGILAVVITVGVGVIVKPWLKEQREASALYEGIEDHEESTLRDAAQLEGSFPDWRKAVRIEGALKDQLWVVSAGIEMYKKQVDTFNARSGKALDYSPRLADLEKAIDALMKTPTNQTSEATSEPAPGASSPAPKG
jgi:predicted negative regulator of RcsB-dependent stress response